VSLPSQPAIVIFAKAAEPGLVKTRMLDRLTPEQAAELHRHCFALICAEAIAVDGVDVVVAITPDNAALPSDGRLRLMPQGDGDLGVRLNRVVDRLFAEGAGPLVIVGCDCVELDRVLLSQAFQRLTNCFRTSLWHRRLAGEFTGGTPVPQDLKQPLTAADGVIGPAFDGGYYLLGLPRPAPVLFEGIDWGTERVLAQTRDRAAAAGLHLTELPPRRDLDTVDDLVALLNGVDVDHPRLGPFVRFVRGLDIFGGHRD